MEFHRAMYYNQLVGSRKGFYDVGMHLNARLNAMFNEAAVANQPEELIKKYFEAGMKSLVQRYGKELVLEALDIFDDEVDDWMLSVVNRVGEGGSYKEMIRDELPSLGRRIGERVDQLLASRMLE